MGEREPVAEITVASGRPYQAIFCSYSHRDKKVAEHVESACKALGIDYIRDVVTLRSGQVWTEELRALIERADVFQLFWSRHGARSEHVEQEWRHALALGREPSAFIRPVYWSEPMAKAPGELNHLHFAYVPEFSSWIAWRLSLIYRFLARLFRPG